MEIPSAVPNVDYSRKWFVMTALGLGTFLETIDTSVINVALPTFVRVFETDFATVQWLVLAFVLTQATLMLVVGRLGDMVGKKRIFVTGFVIAALGSILCGLAPTIGWLIAFRIIQAVGVALTLALIMGIATEAFPPNERGRAMGAIAAIVSMGIVIGPVVGGFILDTLSWRWLFFINLPFILVGIPVALRYLPETHPSASQRFDFAGAITFFIALLAFLLAMTYGQRGSFGDADVLLFFGVSVLAIATFIAVELHVAQPVVDLRLFQSSLFSVNLFLRLISFVAYVGVLLLLPFYLENIQGLSPRQSGPLITIVSIAFGVMAPISGILADRFGPHRITLTGLLCMLVGCLTLSTLTAETTIFGYVLRILPLGVGMGIFQSPNNSVIMGQAPRDRLGMASSVISVVRTLGRSLGIAFVGMVWSSRVATRMGEGASGSMTDAPIAAQLAGMQETFLAIGGFVLLALVLIVWSMARERGLQKSQRETIPA